MSLSSVVPGPTDPAPPRPQYQITVTDEQLCTITLALRSAYVQATEGRNDNRRFAQMYTERGEQDMAASCHDAVARWEIRMADVIAAGRQIPEHMRGLIADELMPPAGYAV